MSTAPEFRKNETTVEWEHWSSPTGKFSAFGKTPLAGVAVPPRVRTVNISPFEVELTRIPPGATLCPKHYHTAQWEYYIIVSGQGQVLVDDEAVDVEAGDHIVQPPGWAHTVYNSGSQDLVYYVIANNPPQDNVYYPDSDKWGIATTGKVFRVTETTYFDGEDPVDGAIQDS